MLDLSIYISHFPELEVDKINFLKFVFFLSHPTSS